MLQVLHFRSSPDYSSKKIDLSNFDIRDDDLIKIQICQEKTLVYFKISPGQNQTLKSS